MSFNSTTVTAPQFPNTPGFPAGMDLYRTTSPLTEGPFQNSAQDTHDLFFGSADSTVSGGMDIVAENDVSPTLVTQMVAFIDSNSNLLYDEGERVLFYYTVKIFVSKDDSYLRQAYDKTSPLADDVCLFLEDNTTDLFSGRSAYIKIGDNFKADLAKRKQIAEIEGKKLLHLNFISTETDAEYQLEFNGPEIQELIKTGQITNPSQTLLIGLLQALSIGNIILAPLFTALGDGILWITKTTREFIKFQEYHWDPAAQNPNITENDNTSFSPILFSFASAQIEELTTLAENSVGQVSSIIKTELNKKLNEVHSQLSKLQIPLTGYAVPESISSFLDTCFKMIDTIVNNLIDGCESMVKFFIGLDEKWLNALNAFYCGLWNGLVEAVLGIVDLIGYCFIVSGAAGSAMANAQTLIPQFYELMDEAVQTIFEADIPGIVSEAINAIGVGISNFNLFALTGTISIERVAYFVGGVVGFIVELVAGIFWSGGIDGVRATIAKFGKVGEDIFAFLTASVTKILGSAFQFTVENMLILVRKIIELLKKGKEEIAAVIRSVFEALEQAAKLADNIIQEIIRLFKLTSEEVKLIDEVGLSFVKYTDEAFSLCKITYT